MKRYLLARRFLKLGPDTKISIIYTIYTILQLIIFLVLIVSASFLRFKLDLNLHQSPLLIFTFVAGCYISAAITKLILKARRIRYDIFNLYEKLPLVIVTFSPGLIYSISIVLKVLSSSNISMGFALAYVPFISHGIGYFVAIIFATPTLPKLPTPYQRESRNRTWSGSMIDTVMYTGDTIEHLESTMWGTARWLTDREKNILSNVIGDKAYEGLWLGGGFMHHQEGNLITVAPPGKGKGASLIIPNLLLRRFYKHSFVIFDPKGTNACTTARFQSENGQKVIIFDPVNLQRQMGAVHGIERSAFNPLDHIGSNIYNETYQMAEILVPENPSASDKFWDSEARNLVHLILMEIMTDEAFEEDRNLLMLQKGIDCFNFEIFLEQCCNSEALAGRIKILASGFQQMLINDPGMFNSVRSVASSAVKWIANPDIEETLSRSDFSPSDLEKGGVSLYICQPMINKESFAKLSRIIIALCLKTNSQPSMSTKSWVYYLLDEFAIMGKFPEIIEALDYSREYKMRLWLFCQSLSQLDGVYSSNTRDQILGSCGVFQAIQSPDIVTQSYVSSRVGKTTVVERKKVINEGTTSGHTYSNPAPTYKGSYENSQFGKSYGVTESVEKYSIDLISTSNVMTDKHIITLSDLGPMRLVNWNYFVEPIDEIGKQYYAMFGDGRADPNPNYKSNEVLIDRAVLRML